MTIKSILRKEILEKYNKDINDYVPKNDIESWDMYPKYNFVYNKMFICKIENIDYAPMPIIPCNFPVVIKPIVNLLGMGNNSLKIDNISDFLKHSKSSHFWCEYLDGRHLSWDFVIKLGEIQFKFCYIGIKNKFGSFHYWRSLSKIPKIPIGIKKLLKYFSEYTGYLNIETINNKMIDVHLRMGDIDQLPKDFMRLIYLNVIDEKIDTKNKLNTIVSKNYLEKIYLFPIWQEINKNSNLVDIYEYLKINWEDKIIKNDYIIHYYFDVPNHSYPNNMKRWFLLTVNNYRKGKKIKYKIEHDLICKFI